MLGGAIGGILVALITIVCFFFGVTNWEQLRNAVCPPQLDCDPLPGHHLMQTRMALVPADTYRLDERKEPDASLLRVLKKPVFTIDEPFCIQVREVTVGEFRHYARTLDAPGLAHLGTQWENGSGGTPYADNQPAAFIPWQAASGYAAWLSKMTGLTLQLPSREHWAAAAKYYIDKQSLRVGSLQSNNELPRYPDHLLDNLREWSGDQCQRNGHLVLGSDYLTELDSTQGECMADAVQPKVVGIRLILVKAEPHRSPPRESSR